MAGATVDRVEGKPISVTHQTADGRWLAVTIPDPTAFESMRLALDDPIWLLGATWDLLTSNDYKRGRFEDAFAAWLERQDADTATTTLRGTGVQVDEASAPTG